MESMKKPWSMPKISEIKIKMTENLNNFGFNHGGGHPGHKWPGWPHCGPCS